RFGFPLYEFEKRVLDYDLTKASAAPLASRPSTYVFAIDEDAAESDYAAEHGATACFTGQAGDTVFFSTQRTIGPLDYAYLHGLRPELFRHMADAITLSRESAPRVIQKVLRY